MSTTVQIINLVGSSKKNGKKNKPKKPRDSKLQLLELMPTKMKKRRKRMMDSLRPANSAKKSLRAQSRPLACIISAKSV